jgi:tRNA A-37 threonylcarbamoyl transferase component Bud32
VVPGQILAGKLEVERVLGVGGMGVVVAARHLELDQRVAVKFLHQEALSSAEAAARFVREARVAAKIRSEHVARVIDVGRLDNGAPYIVMEYLEGNDLAGQIEAGPITVEDAVDYVIQACDAMAEAHALGIVHRDLKPANLFLTRRTDGAPVVKVLDFGISKLQMPTAADGGLTKTSAMIGSPYYMSPEQMKSPRDVDFRTDIWSLGCILYELLSGQVPFLRETLPELAVAIALEDPPPLEQARREVSPGLAEVVERALTKDRAQRFQHVGELAQALGPFAPERSRFTLERVIKVTGGVSVSAQGAAATRVSRVVTRGGATASAWSDTNGPAKPSRTGLYAAVSAIVVAVLGAGYLLLRSSGAGEPDGTGSAVPAAAAPPPADVAPLSVAAPPTPPLLVTPQGSAAPAAPVVSAPAQTEAPKAARPAARPGADKRGTAPVAAAAPPPPTPVAAPSPPPPAPAATPAKRQSLKIELK